VDASILVPLFYLSIMTLHRVKHAMKMHGKGLLRQKRQVVQNIRKAKELLICIHLSQGRTFTTKAEHPQLSAPNYFEGAGTLGGK
jgi:hypothetical protein